MFITKKHLARRTFLKGAGASIALPFLSAMVPAATAMAKTVAVAKPRAAFFYLPHGFIMDKFTPATEGTDFEFSPILKPLEKYRKYVTVVSGLGNRSAVSSAVHAITPGTWLSCVPPAKNTAPHGGVTVDQLIAAHIGQGTPLPSFEVATEARGGGAACDGTFGCGFGNTISFRTPTTPLPMEYNPRKLFTRLFGRGDSAQERQAIAADYNSLLDMISDQSKDLKKVLGAEDRAVLDDYLQSVREIERRVQLAEENDVSKYQLPEVPAGLPDFHDRVELLHDMIAAAFQADITRVATYMLAAEVSNQAYTHLGISEAFHPLSHHNNSPAKMANLAKLQTWHATVIADFLDKLSSMQEGEGSVLDQMVLLFGSNMSDGAKHNHDPLPLTIIGGGCGKIKGNQHIRLPDHTPVSNLHLTLLEKLGVDTQSFGDSNGRIAEI
jgi:hypothetical protein